MEPFILGVNYWPRNKAMYWWKEFDNNEVLDEFALIRDLGMTMVRIFLLWEDFQPEPGAVNPHAISDLEAVVRIAERLSLKLNITFFTGHMSGPNWAPSWMLLPNQTPSNPARQLISNRKIVHCAYRDPYEDSLVLDAEEVFLREVVSRFSNHSAIGLWNLGNESDLFAKPRNAVIGTRWVQRCLEIIRQVDPITPVTMGLHAPNLVQDDGFRIHDIFSLVDVAVIHGYPMYAEGFVESPLDVDFVPNLCRLTTALCGKPTLAEEFGGCTSAPGCPSEYWEWNAYGHPRHQFMASEEEFAEYVNQVLPNLVSAGAKGALLWCFADYAEQLHNKPPCDEFLHERHFGLVRPDGSIKPHAEVLQRFAATFPVVQKPERPLVLPVSPDEYYENPMDVLRRMFLGVDGAA